MRRLSSLPLAALAILMLCVGHAAAALMAIDLGSEFLKISVIKPGRIPISIVNNEMSKRKSPAAVAFVNGDRLLGDEAAALAVRYPDRVFTRLRDFLGLRYDDPAVLRLVTDHHLAFSPVQAPNRTTVAFNIPTDGKDGSAIYTIEEMVASLLEYAKRLATVAAESPVTDTVLVVPAFWSPAQRQALLDAADLAGLNVMSLVHTHAAAALQYGIERDFTNKTEDVLFFDIGSGAAEASLVRFSAFQDAKASAKNAAISQFEVLDVAWVDHNVGCDALETALVEYFAAQHEAGADAVLASPRAVAKLRKQVKRTKEVLSANTEAPVIVEELLSGQDFRGRITREEFENLVAGVWARAVYPVSELLRRNNISGKDLAAVELLGGCSRVPRVKAMLSDVLGGRGLDMHLDADEAVVLGAGLYAANLSTIFRLRKFGMTDKTPFTVTFQLEEHDYEEHDQQQPKGEESDPSAPRVLMPFLRKFPIKRAIALHNLTENALSVSLAMDTSGGAVLKCCARNIDLGNYTIEGISSVVEKYGRSGKVALHTAVDHSGVFRVDRADASVEVEEEVKVKIPQAGKKDGNSTATGSETGNSTNSTETEEAAAQEEEAKNGHAAEESVGEEGTAVSDAAEENASESTPTSSAEGEKEKEKDEDKYITRKFTRTVKVPLNVTVHGGLSLFKLTAEEKAASRKVLRGLRERDEAKRAAAKARNDLEAYIINTREKMESNEALQAVSTEEQRASLRSALMDAEDWLYGDGDTAKAFELREKLKEVRKEGDAIESRAAEAVARPTAVKAAIDFAELALKAANSWPTMKPWLNETEVEALVQKVTEFKAWVEAKSAEQEGKAGHEDLAFKVADIAKEMDPVRKAFSRLNTKPKPKPKPAPKPAAMENNGTASGNDTTIPEGEDAAGGDGAGKKGWGWKKVFGKKGSETTDGGEEESVNEEPTVDAGAGVEVDEGRESSEEIEEQSPVHEEL